LLGADCFVAGMHARPATRIPANVEQLRFQRKKLSLKSCKHNNPELLPIAQRKS
jgi:hypothetical protein